MSQDLFREVSQPSERAHGASRGTMIVSLAAHAMGLTALVIAPLVATDVLPSPYEAGPVCFFGEPPPPPPAALGRPASEPRDRSEATAANPEAAPVDVPDGIVPERDRRPAFTGGDPTIPPGTGLPDGIMGGTGVVAPPAPPPPPAPRPGGPVRPGQGVRMPLKVMDVTPIYPRLAREARVDGTVIVEATIDTDGRVRDARVLRSVTLLDQAALDAVRQWQYRPTLLNGVPVPVIVTVTVTFRLQ